MACALTLASTWINLYFHPSNKPRGARYFKNIDRRKTKKYINNFILQYFENIYVAHMHFIGEWKASIVWWKEDQLYYGPAFPLPKRLSWGVFRFQKLKINPVTSNV